MECASGRGQRAKGRREMLAELRTCRQDGVCAEEWPRRQTAAPTEQGPGSQTPGRSLDLTLRGRGAGKYWGCGERDLHWHLHGSWRVPSEALPTSGSNHGPAAVQTHSSALQARSWSSQPQTNRLRLHRASFPTAEPSVTGGILPSGCSLTSPGTLLVTEERASCLGLKAVSRRL